ncbi:hypothetical protein JHK87_027974 [Glycine soja]|nr:hypothetical protein JHK87_027974 [Glycine soja]
MFILVGTGYAHGKRRGITLLAVWRAGIYEQGEMKHIKVTLPVIEQIKNTRCYSGLRLQHSNIVPVRLRWRGVWSAVLWSIWIQRNGIVFNEAIPDAASVLDMIIVRSWS